MPHVHGHFTAPAGRPMDRRAAAGKIAPAAGRKAGGNWETLMDDRVKVDCVANAKAVALVIKAAAPRIESTRELPPDLLDALHEARLWRMLLPRSYGGDEVSPVDYVQAIEEIAKADASTAWCIGQTSVCGTITRNMKPEIAAELFQKNPRGVLAWGPTNNAKAIAEKGGYRVNGVWPFASGSKHATWLAAHCFIHEADGTPRRDANGKPVQKTFVVPRERATWQDVWHVMGLKGTGSNTYTLTDVFVPEDYSVDYHALDPTKRVEHGPLYKFSIYQLFGSSFPAIALGIARTMLDDFCALAQSKTPQGQSSVLRESAVVQSQVGVMQSQLAAARAFFLEAWREIWQGAQTGDPTMDQRIRLRMASIHASQTSVQVVEKTYLAAGATAVFEANPFERRFRDMHAVSQQAQSQFSIYEAIGRHYLGLPHGSRLV
jgi:alkylation response protein AidB-like acyl-CoA dehydrogenase